MIDTRPIVTYAKTPSVVVKLKELTPGSVFKADGTMNLCMLVEDLSASVEDMSPCVDIKTGYLIDLGNERVVVPIKSELLILGEYNGKE